MNKFNLLKYAIDYLSKYNASKNHLERILRAKIIRFTKNTCENLKNEGKTPKFLFVGKKAYNSLKKKFEASILDNFIDYANPSIKFELSSEIRDRAMTLFTNNEIDECYLISPKFYIR